MIRFATCLAAALCFPAAAWAGLSADQTPFNGYRGLWVSRYEYSTPAHVRNIMANAAALGFTDVTFQVRGQADAYYDSAFEHRAVTSFDPLELALSEAHARGLKLHAWINVMPLWRGATLPSAPDHLINQHPEFWIRDAQNTPQSLNSIYVIVNPARDDVQTHLKNVARDIASKYEIDGLHLDYIRLYENNAGANNPLERPADPFTVSLFQQSHPGQTPTSHAANFKAWMASRITDLVSGLRDTLKDARPDAQLTAAVWRDPAIGLDDYQQDWATWVDRGLLDAAMPMVYFKNSPTYTANVETNVNLPTDSVSILPGVGAYLQDDAASAYANLTHQLTTARDLGANGVQVFSYNSLFGGGAAAAERQRAVRDFFAANSAPAEMTMIADFEQDEGYFGWSFATAGNNEHVARGSFAQRVDDVARTGVASQELLVKKSPAGEGFFLRHLSGLGQAGDFESNLQMPSIGSVGFWLKTTDENLQVSLAVDDSDDGDRAYFQNVIADGAWHKYEWFLNDDSHWSATTGVGGDGRVASIFSIDSIQLVGDADASVHLDDVFYAPAAVARDQWRHDGDGLWHNAGHWTGPIPSGVGAAANLLRRAATDSRVTLASDVTLGALTIDNAASYTIDGAATMIFDSGGGGASLRVVNRGIHFMQTAVRLDDDLAAFVDRGSVLSMTGPVGGDGGLVKTGAGALSIFDADGFSGDVRVDAGRLNAAGRFDGDLTVSAGGVFSPGDEIGAITLGGDLILEAGGVLAIDIGGLRAGVGHDRITVLGSAVLGGIFDVSLVDAFTPSAGQRFEVLSGVITGAFDEIRLPSLAEGLAWDVSDLTRVGSLGVISSVVALPGDANGDGRVDLEDLNNVRNNFGGSGLGDANNDGLVDLADLNAVRNNFGAVLASAVPEPGGWLLALLGGVGLAACAWRRRSPADNLANR